MRMNAMDDDSLNRLSGKIVGILEKFDDSALREDYEDEEFGGNALLYLRLGTPRVDSLSDDKLVEIVSQMEFLGQAKALVQVRRELIAYMDVPEETKREAFAEARRDIEFINHQLRACKQFLRILRDRIPR